MELGLAVKRRRVYCGEPNGIAEAAFARKYVSYLVPALTKMKESSEESDSLKKVVRYEVDMALVLSAQASAWSKALKLSLNSSSSSSMVMNKSDRNLTAAAAAEEEDGAGGDEEDEKEAMTRLRRLVPGGEEICYEQEMLAELKSYVRCLQMQVNILQCMAQQSRSF